MSHSTWKTQIELCRLSKGFATNFNKKDSSSLIPPLNYFLHSKQSSRPAIKMLPVVTTPYINYTNLKAEKARKARTMESEDEEKVHKSKNLKAERKRREKLSSRLLELRKLVPNISKMTKAAIITDAITYIEELESSAKNLSDELVQMDVNLDESLEAQKTDELNNQEDMTSWGIKPKVEVIQLNGDKLWIQIVCPKKRGGFSKLMEAINALGFHLKDTSATSSKGALLITLCVEDQHQGFAKLDQIKEFLRETIKRIYE